MAQKGRYGPRTRFQRWCPDTFPPYWLWTYLRIFGQLLPVGGASLLPLEDSGWAEAAEDIPSASFSYVGTAVWNGAPVTWEFYHRLAMPDPGVLVEMVVSDGVGFAYDLYHYAGGLDWMPGPDVPFTGPILSLEAPPFTPFRTWGVNGRGWHQM